MYITEYLKYNISFYQSDISTETDLEFCLIVDFWSYLVVLWI